MKAFVLAAPGKVAAKMEKLRVADAMTEVFSLFKRLNKYIDETMPWALAKEEDKQDRLATVLYNLVEGITIGAALLEAFMPETTERILAQLNAEKRSFESLDTFGLYPSGNKVVEKPEILFARLDLKRGNGKGRRAPPACTGRKGRGVRKLILSQKQRSHLRILRSCSSRLARSLPVRQ